MKDEHLELDLKNRTRLFLPALLSDETIAIIAAYQDQRMIAGAIAICTGEVVKEDVSLYLDRSR